MILIRAAEISDAAAILAIYEPYILNTAVTYEYEKIPLKIFEKRMEAVMKKLPWLVAEEEGVIVGYAYASEHLERAAFQWDCETSVYIAPGHQGKGIAKRFYQILLHLLKKLHYTTVYALINLPNEESVSLHQQFGFSKLAVYQRTAYKLDEWRDLLAMEKRLSMPEKPLPIQSNWRDYLFEQP